MGFFLILFICTWSIVPIKRNGCIHVGSVCVYMCAFMFALSCVCIRVQTATANTESHTASLCMVHAARAKILVLLCFALMAARVETHSTSERQTLQVM